MGLTETERRARLIVGTLLDTRAPVRDHSDKVTWVAEQLREHADQNARRQVADQVRRKRRTREYLLSVIAKIAHPHVCQEPWGHEGHCRCGCGHDLGDKVERASGLTNGQLSCGPVGVQGLENPS